MAAIWSIDMPLPTTLSDFLTCTPVRYDPEAREWSPPPSPSASAWWLDSPVTTTSCFRNGSSGSRMGDSVKSRPAPFGSQFS